MHFYGGNRSARGVSVALFGWVLFFIDFVHCGRLTSEMFSACCNTVYTTNWIRCISITSTVSHIQGSHRCPVSVTLNH